MKNVSELRHIENSKLKAFIKAISKSDILELDNWVKENLSIDDNLNGVYVFETTPPTPNDYKYEIVLLKYDDENHFFIRIPFKEKFGQFSDYKNGYIEFKGGKESFILVLGGKEPLVYNIKMKPYFDKIYDDPRQIKKIPYSIKYSDALEGFKEIANISFYEKQKNFNNIFKEIKEERDLIRWAFSENPKDNNDKINI